MSQLFERLAAGSTVVTVNSRLSLHLQQAYEHWQQAQGALSWPTPQIVPLTAWLRQLWQACAWQLDATPPTLLSEEQSLTVWESVIRDSDAVLLSPAGTARSAMQAWRLLQQWRLTPASLLDFDHEDSRAFHAWAQDFQTRCRRHHWLDEASLITWLTQPLAAGRGRLPEEMLWLGFDELTPQLAHLQQVLSARGVVVRRLDDEQPAGQLMRLPCADSQHEIRQAAAWLRQVLLDGASGPIGIVVPDLAALRADIERIFDEVLLPEAALDLQRLPQRPYNISLGRPLAELPVIHSALLMLEIGGASRPRPLARWSRLLLSPYLNGSERELAARVRLDARLRKHGEDELTARQVMYHAERSGAHGLLALLQQFDQLRAEQPRLQSLSGWRDSFQRLLQTAGWPGDCAQDSETYQTIQAWQKLLTRLVSLDQVLPQQNFNDALSRLRQLAQSTLFQAQSRQEPVQVLGVLEAAGLRFSHCWLMGLHDGVWPPAPAPNPFLPIQLQRRLQMPHASAERELDYARTISRRLFAAAPEVIVSHPQHEGDSDLRPSPLISALPLLTQPSWTPPERYRQQLFAARRHERYADWQAPAVSGGTPVRGGTSVFKDQAACPFRAFARHRLGAEGLEQAEPGLNAAERGNLVHALLEQLWRTLGDQATLNALDDEALQQHIAEAAQQLIADEAQRYPQVFTTRFAELEQARLQRLVFDWLTLERSRSPFVIAELEESHEVNFAGLQVNIKADRIDRLADGSYMVIDYKTGNVSANDWFGERPNEPQLPLYAITSEREVSALAFAKLRPGEIKFEGSAREEAEVKELKASKVPWSVQTGLWRDELQALALGFRDGRAEVDPKDAFKNARKVCTFCQLGPLCRINELAGSLVDEEGEHD